MAAREIDKEESVKADPRIKRYRLADGSTRYKVRFRYSDGRPSNKRGLRTIPEARRWLEDRNAKARQGSEVRVSAGRVTVRDLWDDFHEQKRVALKPSALASLESSWTTHVEPRWGSVAVAKVAASDVQEWVTSLKSTRGEKRPASASIVIRAAGVLRGILGTAVRDKRITRNPLDDVTLPRKPKGKSGEARRYLTHREVTKLATAVGPERGLIVYITAYCGLRFGEVNGLRVDDYDSNRRRIRVVRTYTQDRAGTWHVGSPKSHEQRTVPVPNFLGFLLDQHVKTREETERLFVRQSGDQTQPLPYPGKANGWSEASWLERGLIAAGLARLTIHDLRHTAASLAVQAGANVKAVQRMLGHASAAETLDVYADLFDEDLDDIAARLDQARAESESK
ncbi:tyrosine-type recombinase/integrase [Brevibacterium linens]|uniref:Site-specific recombinase XerD n=1 Tax=Brevibacterium linens TaxID=1703 RepID=A0A2H1IKG9_BRELN|nr:site-specific integrase [Brevibacterium linens]SMX75654.1 Site-specific recombinase XerD [Brevibacterium linens]